MLNDVFTTDFLTPAAIIIMASHPSTWQRPFIWPDTKEGYRILLMTLNGEARASNASFKLVKSFPRSGGRQEGMATFTRL